jgi:hypothetical protein
MMDTDDDESASTHDGDGELLPGPAVNPLDILTPFTGPLCKHFKRFNHFGRRTVWII